MVTASHNPAEYNGYKAYGPDGCQMTSESADEVLSYIQQTDVFEGVRCISLEEGISSGMIVPVGEDAIEAYYQEVLSCRCVPDAPGPGRAFPLFILLSTAPEICRCGISSQRSESPTSRWWRNSSCLTAIFRPAPIRIRSFGGDGSGPVLCGEERRRSADRHRTPTPTGSAWRCAGMEATPC